MKIVQVIPSLAKGGAERLVVDLSNSLSNIDGIELVLLTFSEKNDFVFLTENIKIKTIPAKVIPSLKGAWFKETQELNDFINQFKPNVIHLHLFESLIVFSEISYENAKYIVHFHDNMVQFNKLTWGTIFNKKSWTNRYEFISIKRKYKTRKITAISISSSNFEFVKEVVPKTWRTYLSPNAVDLSRFSKSINIGGNHLVTIGSLNTNKNQQFLIHTIKRLIFEGVEINLTIIGDGPLSDELKLEVQQLNLQDYIQFTGAIDFPEHILSKSSIYVHSSVSEAFGLVFIEAMASGLPIIATDAMGNRDLIKNQSNGFLILEHNIVEFSDCIKEILNDRKLAQLFSDNNIKKSKDYSIENYCDNLLRLYQI
jgi:glycosyltransferase involved in cell wall biosynthesis